ncbi:ankyrin repeat-containing domain protein [Rhexocercosporidium sp. MPI-PUGE-AT-0058]|nr:ankyrin repeat-containing domain protein [Rhexocercosporidium sp. MPI-PUGE-AT-0058]
MPDHIFLCLIKDRDAATLPPKCDSQGCEGYILPISKSSFPLVMDPLSLAVSGLTIAGAAGTTASSASSFYKNFRDAEKQVCHAQRQQAHLRANQAQLDSLSPEIRRRIVPAELSIAEITSALPIEFKSGKKRDRLRWAAGGKGKVIGDLALLKETESSLKLTLVLAVLQKIEELQKELALERSAAEQHRNNFHAFQNNRNSQICCLLAIAHRRQSPRISASIHRFMWLVYYLGINASLVISRDYYHSTYSMRFRWPILWGRVLRGHMNIKEGWPSALSMTLCPQRIVPLDSEIVKACKSNDIPRIQDLFASGQAHPNDMVPGNLTLLRFAIRAGHLSAVKTLLDQGADPNLTFGTKETSALNNAFLLGHSTILRLLLAAGADLEYVNARAWTSLFYLWDPDLPNHSCTLEILDICCANRFNGWDYSDTVGWAPIHRAAAFGFGFHVSKLINLGASVNRETVFGNWTPLQCAARYGNMSTFSFLAEHIPVPILLTLKDSRGWTLLHLAAASGSAKMITFLVEVGVDPRALSDPASVLVPEELEYKELTPQKIAEYYGHGRLFDDALLAAGLSDRKEPMEKQGVFELP